jgi:hypothetical protein
MKIWESIFAQSRVNYGYYDEQNLPHVPWRGRAQLGSRRAGTTCADIN